MDSWQAIQERHSVRGYLDRPIDGETLTALQEAVRACNQEGDLHIQLCVNEPEAFNSMMARYGRFKNTKNYIALVGKKSDALLDEKCGYYGERLVLRAQQLGLNTCWVAMSFSKGKSKRSLAIGAGEKLLMVIALGYGETPGIPHTSRPLESLYQVEGTAPEWFLRGMEAAQLAPTAMNQQKFRFSLQGTKVTAAPGSGFYTKVDLGIAKYHFEVGAGKDTQWTWAEAR